MRFVLAVIVIMVSSASFAATKINDPSGLLPQIRNFVKQVPFASQFQCTDKATYGAVVISCEDIGCENGGCWQLCQTTDDAGGFPIERSVMNCAADSVSLFTKETGDLSEITRAQYEASGSNSAEFFLSDLDRLTNYVGAEVYLSKVEKTTYTLARGTPQQRAVSAMHVYFEYGLPNNDRFDALMTVVESAPGVAQIGRFRLGSQTWFLLKDFPARN